MTVTDRLNNIAVGIEQIKLSTRQADNNASSVQGSSESRDDSGSRERRAEQEERERAAKELADDVILQAEKFKADATVPNKGKVTQMGKYDYSLDDEFFHNTCHIDDTLVTKIQNGEFVDLEKLLAKALKTPFNDNDQRLDIVNKEGRPYFIPYAEKEQKITNVRKMGTSISFVQYGLYPG